MSKLQCGVVFEPLTPVWWCFTPIHNSETNTSQGKADYTVVNTIFKKEQTALGNYAYVKSLW